jgi:Zn-finger protein
LGYLDWFVAHSKKHKKIVDKLSHLSDDEIIEYFRFENMVQNEPEFCPLYAQNRKCHEVENLNCYLCACPYFRFDDDGLDIKDGKVIKSICSIDAKDKAWSIHQDVVHLDCSNCLLPHKKGFIKKHFSRDWLEIMKDVKEIKNS